MIEETKQFQFLQFNSNDINFMLLTNGWCGYIYIYIYNIQVHIRKKGQQTVQNMLSCITSKIPEQNIYQAAVIWVILLQLHKLQVIRKQYFCRKVYTKTWLHPSHNLKALFYYIPVHNLHYNATAETKTACYKMCTSYSTIRMKVSFLSLYKIHVLKT